MAVLLAIPILAIAAGPAVAIPISNGDDYVTAAPVGDPTAASTDVNSETIPVGTLTFTANVESWVYSDSDTNPYSITDISADGSVSGALTFVYQISVTSPTGDVGQLDVSSFGSNQTDVGFYDQTQFTTQSQILPTYVDRDLTGTTSTVSFLFFPTPNVPLEPPSQYQVVSAGETSALLVVNTDATTYQSTYAELQDGSNGTALSFAVYGPTLVQTPEPTSIVLMILGSTGLLAARACQRDLADSRRECGRETRPGLKQGGAGAVEFVESVWRRAVGVR
ncbi:MAG TPA: PEP-CTERM sorting domain-containing protein [Pirellulales bacterium]|nr:PEP-CTERM sorting domain-containing protein [Pirellulales bacterium]